MPVANIRIDAAEAEGLVDRLRAIVGPSNLFVGARRTRAFVEGYRAGTGRALAVVRPRSLVMLWRALCACVDAGAIVIVQAANTGLTGGSTPRPDGYDRPVVVITTLSLDVIHPIDDGRQVICLPGATLNKLESVLAPLNREPHSVIGSSCFGASVIGGICNSSGGSLVRRGPAYTELALFARVTADRRVVLVNHLGVDLPDDPESALERVARGDFRAAPSDGSRLASNVHYQSKVRQIESSEPARYNADPEGLHEASGCGGKLCVFAVRLDTFPRDAATRTFYIGTNDASELTRLRRTLLTRDGELPVAAEYMHRNAFDMAATYGKDAFLTIRWLGTRRLPALLRSAARFDAIVEGCGGPTHGSDRLLHALARFAPQHLPARLRTYRDRYEHHLLLKVADAEIAPVRDLLLELFPSAAGDAFVCTEREARDAFLHRFVTAGAAVRYRNISRDGGDVWALDIALPRNTTDWFEVLPAEMRDRIDRALYYGHFLCHVLHQDYVLKPGVDARQTKQQLLALLDERGARYPAEHNVGHSYRAEATLDAFYRALDPTNILNPGVGLLPAGAGWRD